MNTQNNAIASTVVADKAIKSKLEHYSVISMQINALERERNALKADLLKATNGADHIMDTKGHEIAAWHSQIRQIIDTQRLKVENQAVYERYLKDCSYVTLAVYFKK